MSLKQAEWCLIFYCQAHYRSATVSSSRVRDQGTVHGAAQQTGAEQILSSSQTGLGFVEGHLGSASTFMTFLTCSFTPTQLLENIKPRVKLPVQLKLTLRFSFVMLNINTLPFACHFSPINQEIRHQNVHMVIVYPCNILLPVFFFSWTPCTKPSMHKLHLVNPGKWILWV